MNMKITFLALGAKWGFFGSRSNFGRADAVAARTTMTGTHEGDLFGLPPTGRRVRVAQHTIERFRDGRIVAHHRLTDDLSMLRQLGVLPAT